ncbi:winged helix-turn-helix transcriptional regulator [Rhizobium rosettiformans]|uniref:winged helix-turn-helix transcriptional regulator n=1 Tax=Rhizobium rosettiformans TaxID=1368430 RepID=UPI002858018F|nr:helix-turn-helix domain-containing protein [Rhizobium rosettiformans]MDR7026898.1 DNA-binding HxlR family transcriptional regulator [Rhizobium rosettiformans]MDR7065019.1 DNA-binding HxlR family transcriptional regulator [Rhizobium rosettiformans]
MSRPRAKMTNNFPGCPVETTLSFLDGKWKGVILYHLLVDGTLRFSELRRRLQAVTQRMLTKQLRELEEQGLVVRTVYPVVPPCVDYALTPLGQSLRPVIMVLEQWGSRHVRCEDGQRLLVTPDAIENEASAA